MGIQRYLPDRGDCHEQGLRHGQPVPHLQLDPATAHGYSYEAESTKTQANSVDRNASEPAELGECDTV